MTETRIWVEITRGHRRGARGWHDGVMLTRAGAGGRLVVRLPGCAFPRDAVMKWPGDLRVLTDVETMAERMRAA